MRFVMDQLALLGPFWAPFGLFLGLQRAVSDGLGVFLLAFGMFSGVIEGF